MHSDLRIIVPGFATAYIARDHGYVIYDMLLVTAHSPTMTELAENCHAL